MIRFDDDREQGLRTGYEALGSRAPASFDSFERWFYGWQVRCLRDGTKPIGCFMRLGPEVHIAIIPEYRRRWLRKGLIDALLMSVINEHGYAITAVMKDNELGHQFVRGLGFHCIDTGDEMLFYRMGPALC